MQLLTSLPRGSPPWPPHLPQDMTRGPEEPLQGPPSGGLCSLHPLTYAPPPHLVLTRPPGARTRLLPPGPSRGAPSAAERCASLPVYALEWLVVPQTGPVGAFRLVCS